MDDTPEPQSVAWRKGETPVPVNVAVVSRHEDPEARLRNLEEGFRDHGVQLVEHGRVLKAIEDHLGQLVEQFSKLRTAALITVVVVFGGTENGEKLITTLSGLFH